MCVYVISIKGEWKEGESRVSHLSGRKEGVRERELDSNREKERDKDSACSFSVCISLSSFLSQLILAHCVSALWVFLYLFWHHDLWSIAISC